MTLNCNSLATYSFTFLYLCPPPRRWPCTSPLHIPSIWREILLVKNYNFAGKNANNPVTTAFMTHGLIIHRFRIFYNTVRYITFTTQPLNLTQKLGLREVKSFTPGYPAMQKQSCQSTLGSLIQSRVSLSVLHVW